MRSSRDLGGLSPERRDALPTVPEKTAMDLPRTSSVNDDTSGRRGRPRLTWAVDLGVEVRAMTTVDLWYSLNVGDLSPNVLVWRLGLEGWAPAHEVPEVACAIRQMPVELPIDQELRMAEELRDTLGLSFEIPSRSAPTLAAVTTDAALVTQLEEPFVEAGSPLPSHVRELRPSNVGMARRSSPRLTRRYAGIAAAVGAALAVVSALVSDSAALTPGIETGANLVAVQEIAVVEPPAPAAPAAAPPVDRTVVRESASHAQTSMAKCPVATPAPKTPAAPRAKTNPWRARPALANPSAGARGQVRARRSSR